MIVGKLFEFGVSVVFTLGNTDASGPTYDHVCMSMLVVLVLRDVGCSKV